MEGGEGRRDVVIGGWMERRKERNAKTFHH